MHELATPFFLISEAALQKNLQRIQTLRNLSGAKIVFALKVFFDLGRLRLDASVYGWHHQQFSI